MNIVVWNLEGAYKISMEDTSIFLKNYDVVAVIESWVGVKDKVPELEGMTLISKIDARKKTGVVKGRKSGGILVYCKEELKSQFSVLPNSESVIWLKMEKEVFGFVYNPPVGSVYAEEDFFDSLSARLIELQDSVVHCAGDFNARVGSNSDKLEEYQEDGIYDLGGSIVGERRSMDGVCNVSGAKLLELCRKNGMRIANGRTISDRDGKYTFCNANGASLIDYYLMKDEDFEKVLDLEVIPRTESCHFPISVKVRLQSPRPKENIKEDRKLLYKNTVPKYIWNDNISGAVARKMEENGKWIQAVITDDKICNSAEKLEASIEQWMGRILVPCKVGPKKSYNKAKKSAKLRALMVVKAKKFHECGGDVARQEFSRAKKEYKSVYRKEKEEKRRESLEKLENARRDNNWKEMWKVIRGNLRIKESVFPAKDMGGDWEPHFEKLLNVNFGEDKIEWRNWEGFLESCDELDKEVTNREVVMAIESMKCNSAPGKDGIGNGFYRRLMTHVVDPLRVLFNAAVKTGTMPEEWGHALVVPLYKGKNSRKDVNNYRGISLLPCRGKLLASILLRRLVAWESSKKILVGAQAGFRAGHATVDQMIILDSIIKRRLRKKETTYVCWIDFEKCFDSIQRAALWYKLLKCGVSVKFVTLVKSLYDECKFAVKIGDDYSEARRSTTGVLQGSQLSPFLFLLFINDLATTLRDVKGAYPPCFGANECPVLMFADDCALLSTSIKGLQRLLGEVERYCNIWGLRVNTGKTKVTVFKGSTKLKNSEKWMYKRECLEVVNSFKYLGVTFSFNGKWRRHIKSVSQKAEFAANKILGFAMRFKELNHKEVLKIFDAVVVPMLLYGCELFGTEEITELMAVVERKFIRRLIGLPNSIPGAALELMLGRIGVRDKARLAALMYWKKSVNKKNEILGECLKFHRGIEGDKSCCMVSNIKKELDSMGLSYLWENPQRLGVRKFKNLVKRRIQDISLQRNLATLGALKSAEFFVSMRPGLNFKNRLEGLKRGRLRLFFKICFNSFEEFIERPMEGVKLCKNCGEIINIDVAVHRFAECCALWKERLNYEEDKWFRELKNTVAENGNSRRKLIDGIKEWGHEVLSVILF